MINLNHKLCASEGCFTVPSYGVLGSRAQFCKEHCVPGMVDVRSKRCEHDGCDTVPTFNFRGIKAARFCKTHALHGMVDVKSRRCRHPECDMVPSFGAAGSRTPLYCKEHKAPHMVDLKSKRCAQIGCDMNPCYGFSYTPSIMYCRVHSTPGMVDVKHRRCAHDGCDVRPVFNVAGQRSPLYCRQHSTAGMIDIMTRRCAHDGCDACPAYNYAGVRQGLYCRIHALPGMMDTRNARCDAPDGCATRAMFGVPARAATKCAKHREKGMIRYPKKRCSKWRCMHVGTHEKNADRYCETHAPADAINLALRPCTSCGLMDVLVDGKCDSCDPERIKRVRHVKEQRVACLLDREGIRYVHDKILDGSQCGLERPDFVIDCGTHLVILEVDENQHDTYACACELARMINLAQVAGMPTTFVRYNPDVYESRHKCVTNGERLEVLASWLKVVMHHSPVETHGAVVDVLYLFYDDYDPVKPERRVILPAHTD